MDLSWVGEAQKVLKGVVRKTLLMPADRIGDNLWFKPENLQMTGSFKIRGAYNKIAHMSDEEAAKGVVTCSAGNHAQGVAYSATKRGVRSIVCMPADCPLFKVNATKHYGADVVLVPGNYDDAQEEVKRLVEKEGYTVAHPFDDEYVIAGQGTIGLEILDELPDVDQVLVPVGGGGLISGVALAIKSVRPSCKVIGVEAASVPSMQASLEAGERVEVADAPTIADGIHVLKPGEKTYQLVSKYVDEIVTVSEEEIAKAVVVLMEQQKLVAEGAGATSVAAYISGKVDHGPKTVCLISGGNVDMTTLRRVISRGNRALHRIMTVETKVEDKPGQLLKLVQILNEYKANILNIDHKRNWIRSDVHQAVTQITMETLDQAHQEAIIKAITDAGFEVIQR